jgi:proline iminopeptidase
MDASSQHHQFYPPISPFSHGLLPVGGRHELYYEQSGNPSGVPVVFLHGGPGGGTNGSHRRFFDPAHYHIILFDQRGSGRSRPYADITENTTGHLIEDMETLRDHLDLERWIVFGGSWGSTLAIAYGVTHPKRCLAFVLRGVFLARAQELDWFLSGMRTIYPDAFVDFEQALPEDERPGLLDNYYKRLISTNENIHIPVANAWNRYESACSQLIPPESSGGGGSIGLALARIEAHYFVNQMFLADQPLLERMDQIAHLPARIIQGRYDIVCPIATAFELSQKWDNAHLTIIPDAGHSAMEPGIKSALIEAMEDLKSLGN